MVSMETKKGTVTSLSSMFPADEAQKASRRVQDTIDERQHQLDQLKAFIDDNISLINLVHKLPHETHHNIMVPFGKAAFFPGRLIHTNEFMVLLGDGYYAERTSKQTAEILKRRDTALETQVESLKAIMQDLKAEASFFEITAQESAEGLVEIREDYVEEGSSEALATGRKKFDSTLEVDDRKAAVEDDEYTRIFSRISELEKEEEEAEKANESDEDEQTQNELVRSANQISIDQEVKSSQVETSEVPAVSKEKYRPQRYLCDFLTYVLLTFLWGRAVIYWNCLINDGSSTGNHPAPNSNMMNKAFEVPEEEKRDQTPLTASNTQAFTGSIVEHAHDIGKNLTEQQSGARTSKPRVSEVVLCSRIKAQFQL
ncbi:hypothetical protein BUALT_Bualt01G0164900 [Buddleja alternifolia]|uniref:Uncharacterized protein n=1 Tax=Buddleja alternifolia TaxID=168488 RepID=A0AAV6Y9A2_9LAMI|nr:hypothetical protein BUALT_Bualt01G0164900 [Buddleja alternifolia]